MEEFQKTKMWKIADYQKPKAKCRSYSPTQMKTAYHLCRDTGAPIRTTARQYGVPEATLRHKLSGRINPEAVRSGPPPLFTQEEEAKLVEHLKFNASLGHGYSRKEVLDIATEYAVALGYRKPGESLSLGWFVLLTSRWPELKISQGPKNPRVKKRMATTTEQDTTIMAKKKKLKQGHIDSSPSQTTGAEGVNKTVETSIHNMDNNTGGGGSGSVSDNKDSGSVIQDMSLISGNENVSTKPLNHNFVKQKGASGNQRIVDRKLIPRIQEYLDCRPNKKNVSIPAIAEYLQNRYQEYSRRKYGVFAKYVEKAYSMMDHESDSDHSQLDSESDEAESENGKPRISEKGICKEYRRDSLKIGETGSQGATCGFIYNSPENQDESQNYRWAKIPGMKIYWPVQVIRQMPTQLILYCKSENTDIGATAESGKLGRLLNHSKTLGNCHPKTVGIEDQPCIVLVASRDISVGEELLFDYGDRSKPALESHPWLKC